MANDCPVNVERMTTVDSIVGEDADETKLLKEMAKEILLKSHSLKETMMKIQLNG